MIIGGNCSESINRNITTMIDTNLDLIAHIINVSISMSLKKSSTASRRILVLENAVLLSPSICKNAKNF